MHVHAFAVVIASITVCEDKKKKKKGVKGA